jgi:hypothetical protein
VPDPAHLHQQERKEKKRKEKKKGRKNHFGTMGPRPG